MKYLAIAFMALALSACGTVNAITTANVQIKNASESAQFRKLCKARPTVYSIYVLVGQAIVIPANVQKNVDLANNEFRDLCINPPQDIIAAVKQATALYNRILDSNQTVALTVATAISNK